MGDVAPRPKYFQLKHELVFQQSYNRAQVGFQRKRSLRLESVMQYKDIVTIEPGKRGGKPCIRGMRITVYDVLEYLASGMSHQEILDDFPYLTKDDILACLSFTAKRERSMLAVQP